MIKSHPTLAVQKPYRLLSLSVVSIMVSIASQTVVANDSIPSTGSASGAAATEAGESSNDMPSTTLETIRVVASNLSNSEDTEDYVYERQSTATGLTLTSKETPQSVTTITNQQIEDQRLETVDDVIRSTPGISGAKIDGGRNSASARGFDIDQYQIDGQDVDFVSQWSNGESLASTAIYDRVEVVRGAAGLTTGSGQPSASINLVRKRADSRTPEATVTATADHYGKYGATLDASTPLSADGDVRGRFIAEYQDGDTYIDREDKQLGLFYGVLDADISEATKVSVGASYQDNVQNSTMWGSLPAYFADGSKAEWDIGKNASVDWVKWNSTNQTYFGTVTHDFNDDWRFELKGSRSENESNDKLFYLSGNTVDQYTGEGLAVYNGRYESERNQDNVQASVDGYFDAFGQTHEVRFGASYNKNDLTAYSYTATPNFGPIDNFLEWDGSYAEPEWSDKSLSTQLTTKEKSVFASGRLQLADPLALILGSRVTDYEYEGVNFGTDIDISHDSVWVPYIGTTYDVTDNHTLFASYTSIFEPQEETDVSNSYLDPIEGDNYELGIKSSSDDGMVQGQFSVFRIKQDNLAQEDVDNIDPNDPETTPYIGAEGATSTGIDVEVTGRITPEWQTSIGYTQFIAEDKYGDAVNTGYADRLLKLFTTYDMSNWVSGLTVGGGVNWSDDRYTMMTNPASGLDEKYTQDAVTLVNLMARYDVSEKLAMQLNVDNLFDEQYVDSSSFNQIAYGEPLTVSGKITYKF
ncbi:TonB-dependent siderophore receptor [Psychrobacter sp.]|uniref:TonB-dependent siderophore receptor n=1 Tax=Psychrobacter sp. TaxID=56811 RepID=UPI0026486F30|nr:TonB-dependent siderophore receptor [Psychrobacter sp.]MDN6276365.1 TonB-dependent siderophore receptor [Psychrobacter sp.]MDN6307991.1 TonB-dependent siderophore receptor [Psychrobacter sp.]